MSWMSGLGWKDGLSGVQLSKVEELERSVTKANNNAGQKQQMIDGLNQTLDKLKRKVSVVERNILLDCHFPPNRWAGYLNSDQASSRPIVIGHRRPQHCTLHCHQNWHSRPTVEARRGMQELLSSPTNCLPSF